jgi:predicted Rossmann fold nucleotide-binding protein DprA/Smf involved in DNA uptake
MAKAAKKVRTTSRKSLKSVKKTATPKTPSKNHRAPWTLTQDRLMKRLAKEKASAAEIAAQLGRSAAAIQQRLMMSGISLRALRKVKTRGRIVR